MDVGTARTAHQVHQDCQSHQPDLPRWALGPTGQLPHPVTFCCDFVSGNRNCVRSPSTGRHVRLQRPDLIAKAAKSMDTFDLVSKERVNTLRPACRSCRQSSGC